MKYWEMHVACSYPNPWSFEKKHVCNPQLSIVGAQNSIWNDIFEKKICDGNIETKDYVTISSLVLQIIHVLLSKSPYVLGKSQIFGQPFSNESTNVCQKSPEIIPSSQKKQKKKHFSIPIHSTITTWFDSNSNRKTYNNNNHNKFIHFLKKWDHTQLLSHCILWCIIPWYIMA